MYHMNELINPCLFKGEKKININFTIRKFMDQLYLSIDLPMHYINKLINCCLFKEKY
jgi:hypothetical protein